MDFVIYQMTDIDGYYYIGSTTKTLNERLRSHRASSKVIHTPMLSHFSKVGWDNVMIEQITEGNGNKEDRLRMENECLSTAKDDPFCLNKRLAKIYDKAQALKERSKRYEQNHKKERNQHSRDYYYKKRYGMTENEYKQLEKKSNLQIYYEFEGDAR